MRGMAACFLSAMLGAAMFSWLASPAAHNELLAQDQGSFEGPRLPGAPGPNRAPAAQSRDDELRRLFNREGLSPEEAIAVSVYDKDNKGVVNITTKSSSGFLLLDVASEGTGSGSVIDQAGHILTNYHVIEDAQQVGVTLFDGNNYDATLVGADPINDIAVIKINAPSEVLFPISFADSSNLRVGMRVFAIGNPFGLERTMTTGIISSLNRTLQIRGNRSIKSIIQIDAAVNPGNSGGPLLNSHGQLIGMNTAIASRNGQSAGVGFAIPVNLVTRVVNQLIQHGHVIRPEIGIQSVYETDRGVLITRLTPGGPAERAGLRGPRVVRKNRGPFVTERIDYGAADIVIGVDGQDVKTADDFLGYIETKKAGDQVELVIVREGRKVTVPVVLGGGEKN